MPVREATEVIYIFAKIIKWLARIFVGIIIISGILLRGIFCLISSSLSGNNQTNDNPEGGILASLPRVCILMGGGSQSHSYVKIILLTRSKVCTKSRISKSFYPPRSWEGPTCGRQVGGVKPVLRTTSQKMPD
jgi:hypothetical protein